MLTCYIDFRYSNNYLYKVTGDGRRLNVQNTAGQERMKLPIEKIIENHKCNLRSCHDSIKNISVDALHEWRDRSGEGQKTRRIVIHEMTSQKIFCKLFIQGVTGAGLSCITKTQRNFKS